MLPSPGEGLYHQTAFVKRQAKRFCEAPKAMVIFTQEFGCIRAELRTDDFRIRITLCVEMTTYCGHLRLLVRSRRGGKGPPTY